MCISVVVTADEGGTVCVWNALTGSRWVPGFCPLRPLPPPGGPLHPGARRVTAR